MDDLLRQARDEWSDQISRLKVAELNYRQLAASEKAFYAERYLKTEGKTVAEKESLVFASQPMKDFLQGLAAAQTRYNFELRNLDLAQANFNAHYLSFKVDSAAISRQG